MGKKSGTGSVPEQTGQGTPQNGMPEMRKAAKVLLVLAGVMLSTGGLALCLVFYLNANSAIGTLQDSMDIELDAATASLNEADAAIASAEIGVARLPAISGNLSASLTSLGNATGTAASSLRGLSSSLSSFPFSVGTETARELAVSSRQLDDASASLNASASESEALTLEISEAAGHVSSMRESVSHAVSSLAGARRAIDSTFASARTAALMISLMFAAAFLLLLCYSLSSIL